MPAVTQYEIVVLFHHITACLHAVHQQVVAVVREPVAFVATDDPVVERDAHGIDAYGIAATGYDDRTVVIAVPAVSGAVGEDVTRGTGGRAHGLHAHHFLSFAQGLRQRLVRGHLHEGAPLRCEAL